MRQFFRSRFKKLISKEKIALTSQDASPCVACGLGCGSAPSLAAETRVSARGLVRVVLVLFGIPLLGLFGYVSILQSSGLAAHPLFSLSGLALMGWLWSRLTVPYGGRLLNVLQSQHLP